MDAYNIAYFYLKEKYGYSQSYLTKSAQNLLRYKNKRETKRILNDCTDKDYICVLNPASEEDKEIELLMHQYYLGEAPKIELHNLLTRLNIYDKITSL